MAFTFKHGDRPLEGFTIQRGVGRGGFGEVYYATSDGGKDVALKYLRDNPEIELRGVEQCMNLKNPHLVSIFDVKRNKDGEYFIVMEYISGPSLRDLLNDEPRGMGVQKASFFLREIGKGLAYLHDRGLVHRDLKPGNIFFDDGIVKIGDYGLSKFISISRHSAQTSSVGTVHYMAPEVGTGNYTKGIDIYALGVILYEMLKGQVPFAGSSMGEVLMKHLTQRPEVDQLPQPFARVIRKALEKDPKDRYSSVDEMLAEVFDVAEVRDGLADFSAEKSFAGARIGGVRASDPSPSSNPGGAHAEIANALNEAFALAEGLAGFDDARPGARPPSPPASPALSAVERRKRIVLGIIMTFGVSIGLGIFVGLISRGQEEFAISAGLMTFFGAGGILGARAIIRWLGSTTEPVWVRRMITAFVSGLPLLLGAIPVIDGYQEAGVGAYLGVLAVALFANWEKSLKMGSRGDIGFGDMFGKGLGGFICAAVATGILDARQENVVMLAAIVAAALSLLVQANGWWIQPALAPNKEGPRPKNPGGWNAPQARVDRPQPPFDPVGRANPPVQSPPSPPPPRQGGGHEWGCNWFGPPRGQRVQQVPFAKPVDLKQEPDSAAGALQGSILPKPPLRSGLERSLWSLIAFLFLSAAVFLALLPFVFQHNPALNAKAHPLAVCVAMAAIGVFALSKTTLRRRQGFWGETVRPLLMALLGAYIGTTLLARFVPEYGVNAGPFVRIACDAMRVEVPQPFPRSVFSIESRAPFQRGVLGAAMVAFVLVAFAGRSCCSSRKPFVLPDKSSR